MPRHWQGETLSRVGGRLSVCVVRVGRPQCQSLATVLTQQHTYAQGVTRDLHRFATISAAICTNTRTRL